MEGKPVGDPAELRGREGGALGHLIKGEGTDEGQQLSAPPLDLRAASNSFRRCGCPSHKARTWKSASWHATAQWHQDQVNQLRSNDCGMYFVIHTTNHSTTLKPRTNTYLGGRDRASSSLDLPVLFENSNTTSSPDSLNLLDVAHLNHLVRVNVQVRELGPGILPNPQKRAQQQPPDEPPRATAP